jgi:hypothetical protein
VRIKWTLFIRVQGELYPIYAALNVVAGGLEALGFNALVNNLANEGINKEGHEMDEVWSRIPRGQLRSDNIHLVE